MMELIDSKVFLADGRLERASSLDVEEGRRNTMAYQILQSHNESKDPAHLKIRFDALASHDITYVGIIQTAMGSGLKEIGRASCRERV